jgi:hypothetical protein
MKKTVHGVLEDLFDTEQIEVMLLHNVTTKQSFMLQQSGNNVVSHSKNNNKPSLALPKC